MNILGSISSEEFLRDYWQKKPLLIRNAFPSFSSPLSPEELAGLACEEDVEARLIVEHSNPPWQLQHGPFSEADFARLPETHWTLLVQAVDHWVPEVSNLLQHFKFIPNWRLDDVMISFAPEGGSVGPHYDNYDVFLLQAQGERHWQVGSSCNKNSPRIEHTQLRILKEMDIQCEWTLSPGDMLYLPPRLAHYGVAKNDCMTYSFGFRAPSVGDIAANVGDYLANHLDDDIRYEDSDLQPQKNPGEITNHAITKIHNLLMQTLTQHPQLLARWFGEYMTTPKYGGISDDEFPSYTEQMWLDEFTQCHSVRKEEEARFAYYCHEHTVLFFANGISLPCETNLLPLIELLCQQNEWSPDELKNFINEPHNQLLLATLTSIDALYFT